jgi:DnaJ like chaperone protein
MSKIIVIALVGFFIYALFKAFLAKPPGDKQKSTDQNTGRKYGKWIGGGLGWAFGGPLGAILGFAMGSMFDGTTVSGNIYRGSARGDFAMSLLVLSAAVMKADGKVVKAELDYVRNFFTSQFGVEEANRLIPLLQEILKQEINIQDVSIQVGQFMDYPSKLQLLHYLFGIASADGRFDDKEVSVLDQVAGLMGISAVDYASIRAMFIKNLNSAYDILEITASATDEEVKKAYRKLAVQYHPDKVAHLGEDIHKSATEKFQKLNAAYEEIKKQRGFK